MGASADGSQHDERDLPIKRCRERVSLWSRPSSFLAVSKLSSMARRCPSSPTRVSMVVPAGHQVVKKAQVITGDVAADQQASGPYLDCAIDIFVGFQVG